MARRVRPVRARNRIAGTPAPHASASPRSSGSRPSSYFWCTRALRQCFSALLWFSLVLCCAPRPRGSGSRCRLRLSLPRGAGGLPPHAGDAGCLFAHPVPMRRYWNSPRRVPSAHPGLPRSLMSRASFGTRPCPVGLAPRSFGRLLTLFGVSAHAIASSSASCPCALAEHCRLAAGKTPGLVLAAQLPWRPHRGALRPRVPLPLPAAMRSTLSGG